MKDRKKSDKKKPAYTKVPRSKLRHPTFEPKRAVANRREELECDYIPQLSDSEKDWLNQFNEENVCANFQDKEKLLDKSDEFRKSAYRANNRRNKDTFINAKVRGLLNSTTSESHLEYYLDENRLTNINEMEDIYNDVIDNKRSFEVEELSEAEKKEIIARGGKILKYED